MADKLLTEILQGDENKLPDTLTAKVSASILTKFYKTMLFDIIKGSTKSELLNLVLKDPVKYGYGVRVLQVGLVPVSDWKGIERINTKSNQIQTHQELRSDEIKLVYKLTTNRVFYRRYFKDAATHDNWIGAQTKAVGLSANVDMTSILRFMFGVAEGELTKPLPAEVLKVLQPLKDSITTLGKSKTTPDNTIISFIKTIREESVRLSKTPQVANMISQKVDRTDGESGKVKMPVNISVEQQYLIMSWEDWMEFTHAQHDIRHPEYFKLPEGINVIRADIPKGKAYIVDKNFMNLYTRLGGEVVQRETDTLELDSITHIWLIFGIFFTTAGIIIKRKTTGRRKRDILKDKEPTKEPNKK